MIKFYAFSDVTHDQCEPFRQAHLSKVVHHCLRAQSVPNDGIEGGSEDFDARIELGGDYKDICVQIGDGYFSVVYTQKDDKGEPQAWHFHDSDYHKTLSKALAAAIKTKEANPHA